MKIKDKIEKLLAENTGYFIQKQTGVSQMTVNRIKNGQADIDNLSLKNAQALADMYDAQLISNLQRSIGQQKYTNLVAVITANFKEIIDSQRDLAHSDDGDLSDDLMADILEYLFKKNITDPMFIIEAAKIVDNYKQ
ncbi:hypothetical protein ACKP2L_05235 [Oenococcus alcoholitolerans]|uniref:hypothetical protein n=1 Tax=Oenococcus alcoholitolerans TaxID=931074 RepID=UPI003F71B55E